jgi:hypothetical protein
MAGSIEVFRPSGFSRDVLRSYKVYVDDVKSASIREGRTARIEVAPGAHWVRARIDSCSTPPLQIRVGEDEAVRLVVRPGGSAWSGFQQVLGSPSEYLHLELDSAAYS